MQVQVVLPAATHTDIWVRAGVEASSLPASILIEVDEMVDAALVDLDCRELVTMPSLPDLMDWEAYTAARLHLGPNLSRDHAADRYKRPAGRSCTSPVVGSVAHDRKQER